MRPLLKLKPTKNLVVTVERDDISNIHFYEVVVRRISKPNPLTGHRTSIGTVLPIQFTRLEWAKELARAIDYAIFEADEDGTILQRQ